MPLISTSNKNINKAAIPVGRKSTESCRFSLRWRMSGKIRERAEDGDHGRNEREDYL